MGKNNENRNIDNDIAQSREDVLRANDIIPSDKERDSSRTSDNTGQQKPNSEIPSFDLSGHITNKQRQKTSNSRKPPSRNRASGKKNRVQTDLYRMSFDVPEQKLIREIVARDIAGWYNRQS